MPATFLPRAAWQWLASAFALTGIGAHAFPTTHHYSVATETVTLAAGSARFWDSESSSDYITYLRPLSWDARFLRGRKVMDLTIGSISSREFLVYERLALAEALTDRLEFQLHWIDERDYEQDRRQMPLELKYRFAEKWAASIFGSPSFAKAEDDFGASLFYEPSPEWEYRASAVWGDFDRNTRNRSADRWEEAPVAGTISVKHVPATRAEDFLYLEAHFEPRSRRSLNGAYMTDLSYDSIAASGVRSLPSGDRVGWRVLYDRAFTNDYGASEVTERRRALNSFEYILNEGAAAWRFGLNAFYRQTRTDADQVIFREILPTIWWDMPANASPWGERRASLGYDATVFQQQENSTDKRELEHRLNARLDLKFSRAGELALLFTFDLDRFGSGETWEGGCAQFRLDF